MLIQSERVGRLRLLTSVGREIAQKERELALLRDTQIKLVRQYERGKYQDEISELRLMAQVEL